MTIPFLNPILTRRLCAFIVPCFAVGLISCGTASPYKPIALTAIEGSKSVNPIWERSALSPIDYPVQLALSGQNLAVAGSQGSIGIMNVLTGREVWRHKLNAEIASGVGFDGEMLAVTTLSNELIVLASNASPSTPTKATSSPVLWRQRLASRVYTAPLVAGGRVFVLAGDRSITAFDAQTGARLWVTSRPNEPLILRQSGTLSVFKNTLLVGGAGRLLAVNPDNGSIVWETSVASTRATNDIERLIDVVGVPHRVGDSVCVRAYQASIACVDAQKGLTTWSKSTQGAVGVSGDSQTVVSTESDGRVKLWNRATGDLIWSVDTLAHRGLSAPTVVNNAIVVGDYEGYIHVLNKRDGTLTARAKTDGSALAGAPIVFDNLVLVVTGKGGIFAFNPQ
jgi:outer membrane protein assembly factor BamB